MKLTFGWFGGADLVILRHCKESENSIETTVLWMIFVTYHNDQDKLIYVSVVVKK